MEATFSRGCSYRFPLPASLEARLQPLQWFPEAEKGQLLWESYVGGPSLAVFLLACTTVCGVFMFKEFRHKLSGRAHFGRMTCSIQMAQDAPAYHTYVCAHVEVVRVRIAVESRTATSS